MSNGQHRRMRIRLLAVVCAVLMTAAMMPICVSAADYGYLYEGWKHISQDYTSPAAAGSYIGYDAATHAITFNALNSDGEMLFLNREAADGQNSSDDNRAAFGKGSMSDFTVEFDMSVTDYRGRAAVEGGDLGAGGGSVSFAFMGADDYNFASGAITARIDYTNLGFMWRSYSGIPMPTSYSWSYVDGRFTQWHWRFNSAETCHVRVTKTGYTISMDVGNGAYSYTSTLPSDIGLPTTGHVGLMVEGATVTVSNVVVSNTTPGHETTRSYFTPPTETDVTDTDELFAPFLTATPRVTYVSAYDPDSDPASAANDWSGIRALTYDGAAVGEKKTKVFAYIGFPQEASVTNKVPAIVLVHGGGGHAYAEWVKMWNDRGYAAIAMDTTGFFPSAAGKGIAGRESDNPSILWRYGLYGDFVETGYTNAPNNDEMARSANAFDQQWMYHAVTDVITAHNILKADSRVDASAIGITGISWGGVITSLTIGYDTDYAFAVPVYGSAYLDESLGWMGDIFSREPTRTLWSAAQRLDRVDFPVLWMGWTDDIPFSVNSISRSYEDTRDAGAVMGLKLNWGHSHGYGWAPADISIFADAAVGKRGSLTAVTGEPTVTRNADGTYTAVMTITPAADAASVTANAAYITSPLSYSSKTPGSYYTIDQTWMTKTCTVSGNTVSVTLDSKVDTFFINVTTRTVTGQYDVSSRLTKTAGDYNVTYDGWSHISCDHTDPKAPADYIRFDDQTHAITLDALDSDGEMLFLNRAAGDGQDSSTANQRRFGKDTMTDFVIEFDMTVHDYLGKTSVQVGDLGAGGGSVSLALMGTDAQDFTAGAITTRIDYTNLGIMWRGYDGIPMPATYSWGYADGKFTQWHWRFNNAETCHVKVTKSGYTVTMDVDNGTYVHTATLPSGIGLPAAGYVGLMADGVCVTITDMTVTNTTAGYEDSQTFFTVPVPEHVWSDDWKIIRAATLDETGLACHVCTLCGETDECVTIPAIGTDHVGWFTEPYSEMQYYFGADGVLNTEPRITVDGKICNFYPEGSVVDGVDVSYSYLLGWKKMPNKITRYYEEGEYFFKTGFQSVDDKRYFFNKTSGALYIPSAGVGGMGWYKSGGAYYALSPETGEWIVGLYTDANGDTYYYKKYDTKAGYTTGLVDVNGETYYFDPADGKMVKDATVDFGNHQLTFDADGALAKIVGVYNGCCYDENGDLYAAGLLIEAGGDLYRTTTGGKLDSNYWNRTDPRDSSKKVYLYKGVVLEGMVTIDYGTWTYNNQMGFTESGTYFFEGNTVTPTKGFATAGNGLEYYFSANGKRYETATYAYANKTYYNFYAKNTVIDGVDYSYAHKVGLVTEDGVTHVYVDGTRGYLKNTEVEIDDVIYTVDAGGALTGMRDAPGHATVPDDLGTGRTYYISSSLGDDTNDGLTPSTPFRTAGRVNSQLLTAGDNVLFRRGDVFSGAHLQPKGTGRAEDGKWITVDAYGIGEDPVFRGDDKLKAAISLSEAFTSGGYRIRHLEIDGYGAGIIFRKSGERMFDGLQIENVTVRNCASGRPYGEVTAFPEGLDTGYGIYMEFVRNAVIRNVSVISTDIPLRMYGELTLIDNLYAYDSRVTGVMLYGAAYASTYEQVMASAGGITVQNSRVLYTGKEGLGVGTTGFMLENTKNCTIRSCEVGYTSNGAGDNDACAIDWEQLNIDCTIENVYAHDNDGPFLLAMEHPDSLGGSKGNRVIGCTSVNNGKRDHTACGSFMDHSSYFNADQKILIQNCVDIGIPGSVPYSYWTASSYVPAAQLDQNRLYIDGFTSGVMDVWATFDEGDMSAFRTAEGTAAQDSRLYMTVGGKLRTAYSGSDYVVSSWLKGQAELVFMADGTDSGYFWCFEDGRLTERKVSGGNATVFKTVSLPGLDADTWYRARVEVSSGVIRTYLDDQLIDTVSDGAFTSGTAGVNAVGAVQADEFFVYRYANSARAVQSRQTGAVASGGNLGFFSSTGAYDTPEINWTPGTGVGRYLYCAHGDGRMFIRGIGAYIERRNMNVSVIGGYNTVHLILTNATDCPQMYLDFSTDGGRTWYTKAFTVRAMNGDGGYPFETLYPEFRDYVLDMSDMPAWTGTINGLRVRTDATSGFISIRNVIISK